MSILFFLLSLISLALTINVLRPVYHHPKAIVFSFIFGWPIGELALHVIAVQVFIVFWFWFGGVLDGFWTALAMLGFTCSWLMLAYHYFSGYKAELVMERIVAPHRDKKAGNWSRQMELDSSRLLRPFAVWKHDDVEVMKDIVYAKVDRFNLKLDIRRRYDYQENAPVLLQIHGGAWTQGYGSKNEQGLPLMVEMAKRGWICVAIDYRLSPAATMPDHIVDCKRALAWVKAHISDYGGNPDFIVATGGSAGGHLCALLALTPNLPELQPDFENEDTRVQGCVPFYGIYDLLDDQRHQVSVGLDIILRKSIIKARKTENPDLYRLMSPMNHVNKDAPPFLVIHGDKDSLTSLGEAQYFASELDSVSKQTVEFAEIPGAQHAFDMFASLRSDLVMRGVVERLDQWHRDFSKK